MSLEYLQNYWWLLVSVLGGILVFLLFVQGGKIHRKVPKVLTEKLLYQSLHKFWMPVFSAGSACRMQAGTFFLE